MKITQSECVDCGKPCLREACKYNKVTRYYCDKCGEEDTLYYFFDGRELCAYCVVEELTVVEGSDIYDF